MPALVKRRLGELGSRLAEDTIVGRFSRKKSKKDCLISEAFMMHHQFCFSRIPTKAESRRCAKHRRSSSRSSILVSPNIRQHGRKRIIPFFRCSRPQESEPASAVRPFNFVIPGLNAYGPANALTVECSLQ